MSAGNNNQADNNHQADKRAQESGGCNGGVVTGKVEEQVLKRLDLNKIILYIYDIFNDKQNTLIY